MLQRFGVPHPHENQQLVGAGVCRQQELLTSLWNSKRYGLLCHARGIRTIELEEVAGTVKRSLAIVSPAIFYLTVVLIIKVSHLVPAYAVRYGGPGMSEEALKFISRAYRERDWAALEAIAPPAVLADMMSYRSKFIGQVITTHDRPADGRVFGLIGTLSPDRAILLQLVWSPSGWLIQSVDYYDPNLLGAQAWWVPRLTTRKQNVEMTEWSAP